MKLRNCDFDELMQRLGERKIFCFGNGLPIATLVNTVEIDWENKMAGIIDNDSSLWNEHSTTTKFFFPIFSPDKLRECKAGDYIIIITSQKYWEIIQQLDSIQEINETDCYIFALMQAYSDMDDGNFKTASEIPLIPKTIHYCWFGKKELTDEAKKCLESWERLCPDFEIVRWDEDNYDVETIRYTKEAYQYGGYAFVSDYARLDILYNHGGIYLDVDVEVRRDLSPLLKNHAYCAFSQHVPRIATGLGMGSVKGFSMLLDMMEAYKYEAYMMDYGFNTTMCQLYNTKVLAAHGLVQNGRYQVVDDMTCYPKDYFDPQSSQLGIMVHGEKAFSIHKSANSWTDANVRFRNVKKVAHKKIGETLQRIEATEAVERNYRN